MTGGRRPAVAAALLGLLLTCGPEGPPVRITVPVGATFRAVTDTVVSRGLVQSRFWFRVLARVRGVDREVKAGIYDVPEYAGAWGVLSVLQSGRVATEKFTVPEGLTLLQLADLAQERLGIPRDSVLAAARDTALRRSVAPDAPSLEGYLLPETYHLPLPVTAETLLGAMVEEFRHRWLPAWNARLRGLGESRTQVITLASIVEGEARFDDERPIIAGVYRNRLRLGMPLQADPTVQYALELATGERKSRLWFKDYAVESPYNTYLHPGLPPGPVNSPGLKSIQAALYPADVPYLYFVAGPDGHHIFSRTLDEHNRAIGAVRGRRSNGR
jgi:peptidoglycan lytic transglycosylase G